MSATTKLLPVYLVVGADELKRSDAVKRLRSRVPEDMADFNLEEVEGRAVDDPASLVASLEMMPFAADLRVVIVHGADALPKPASEAVVSYLANPNPQCVLCLEAEKLAKNTRLYKAADRVGKAAGTKSVIECAALKRWELPPYVQRLAASHGGSIGIDAAEELVNRCGESTVMLDNQIVTLVSLLASRSGGPGSPTIMLDDVRANVAQTAEVNPWAFADAVCQRDVARALSLYHDMKKPNEVFLHTVLVDRVRGLVCAQALGARGQSSTLAKELGCAPWQVKNYGTWARAYTARELVGLLDAAARCERALKGSDDTQTAFVSFVLSFAPASARARA